MFRHIAMFRFQEGVDDAQVQAIVDGLAPMTSIVPELRALSCGRDAGVSPGNHDFAITALFDSFEGYVAYRDHPAHQAVLRERILPIISERCAVQFLED